MPHFNRLDRLTSIDRLVLALSSKLDINKVNLQLLLGLDTNQQRRTTTGGDDFIGVVGRFEDERERTFQLLQHGLDEFGEVHALARLRVVDVLGQDGDGFGIGLALERVSTLLEDEAESGGVGDDTIVDDGEIGLGIGLERMAVDDGGRTVRRPPGVCNGDLRKEGLGGVDVGFSDLLAQASYLADLLEEHHLSGLVAVDTNASRVIATVLLPSETVAEDFANRLTVLLKIEH